MGRRKQTRGTCFYCNKIFARGGMKRHLESCPARSAQIEAITNKNVEKLYQLLVHDAWDGDYWIYLEMCGSATLKRLDQYLRAIWLECCGHLSHFSVGGWSGREIPNGRRAADIFQVGDEYIHLYDYGTTSKTVVKVLSQRQGAPLTQHPIMLMARNLEQEVQCIKCGQPARWLCMECLYEDESQGTLCDQHAESHPHDDYGGLFAIVNSPRMGLCGYEGPAEPPY